MLQEYKYSHSLILPVIKFGVNRVNYTEILGFDFELIFSFCKFSFAVLIDATNILRIVPHRLYKSVDSSLSFDSAIRTFFNL